MGLAPTTPGFSGSRSARTVCMDLDLAPRRSRRGVELRHFEACHRSRRHATNVATCLACLDAFGGCAYGVAARCLAGRAGARRAGRGRGRTRKSRRLLLRVAWRPMPDTQPRLPPPSPRLGGSATSRAPPSARLRARTARRRALACRWATQALRSLTGRILGGAESRASSVRLRLTAGRLCGSAARREPAST